MKKCPYCAEEIQEEAIKCRHCGSDLSQLPAAHAVPTPVSTPAARAADGVLSKIDCSACRRTQAMSALKIRRMSPFVAFLGWLLTIPSAIGVACSIVMAIGAVSSGARTEAETAGVGFAIMMALGGAACSLTTGVLGYYLMMKRKVWKCDSCGFVLDRD